MILAFDASTEVVTVAVAREKVGERKILSEISASVDGASEALLPAVHAALDLAGEKLAAVDRILVGVGPGTFTGIRIAASTARAFSLGTGAKLAKNSTLRALAAPALTVNTDVLTVLDAKRGQVFTQHFSDGGPGEIRCLEPETLAAEGHTLIVGDGAVRYREEISGGVSIPPDGSPLHRVTAAGHVLAADLSPVEPEELAPLYIREPDAEVRRERNPWSS